MIASQHGQRIDTEDEDDRLTEIDLMDETQQTLLAPSKQETLTDDFDESAFESYFGLIQPEDLVIIRPYSGEEDEATLQDIRPRFIVMYDPDPAFIRRVEVSHNRASQACHLLIPYTPLPGVSEHKSRPWSARIFHDISRFGRRAEIS
jgi:hypothetical protein